MTAAVHNSVCSCAAAGHYPFAPPVEDPATAPPVAERQRPRRPSRVRVEVGTALPVAPRPATAPPVVARRPQPRRPSSERPCGARDRAARRRAEAAPALPVERAPATAPAVVAR